MLLVPNVGLVCLIVLTQINENAAGTSRTRRNKPNTKENKEILKKLVDFLNDSERTKTNDEPTLISVIDDIDIQDSNEMKTVMKHLQKNYDYEVMAEWTHNKPRVHVIRNPDVLDDFVDTLRKEESIYTITPDVLKSTVRRYGGVGFDREISAENYGKRNKDGRNKYSYQSMYDNKKRNSRFSSREKIDKRINYNKKPYYSSAEKNYNRQKYRSKEKYSERDKYENRYRFDSREKYNNKNKYNQNKDSGYNRNKENNYNRNQDYVAINTKHDTRNKYETRNWFNRHERDKTTFRPNKIPGSRIRSRDEEEKGLDIPENHFKKPSIITLNLGMSSENNNANKKRNDDLVGDNFFAKGTKDWSASFERRKKVETVDNDWGKPAKKLHNKPMGWSEIGIEKKKERNYNDWSQVGIDKSTSQKKEWSNVAIDPSKDWAEVGVGHKKSMKRYYNDEDFTLKEEFDDVTTQFAPAFTEKRKDDFTMPTRDDWDQPMKHYGNKYKERMDKLYTNGPKRPNSDVRSGFAYHPFGRTPIPFVGKRVVYADK